MTHDVANAPHPWSETGIARWSEIADKIVTLAEGFPEDKYEYRPVPQVRSFGDQLRHVAFWNAYVQRTLHGEKPDGAANELSRDAYPTKADVVVVLRKTFAAVATELAKGAARDVADLDTLVTFVEHNGEHYGQLVVYYRLNGLVPPASR